MPSYSDQLNGYRPTMEATSTQGTGSDASAGARNQLDLQSAQDLASRLGATLVQLNYEGGPFSLQKPQYQLDFGTGNMHDANLLYDQYLRAPDKIQFDNQLRDELKNDRSGGYSGSGGYSQPSAPPSPSGAPSGGGGLGTIPPSPLPQTPPNWMQQQLPGAPQRPPVTQYPGSGVGNPGGYTVPGLFSGVFPAPDELLAPTGMARSMRPQGLLTPLQKKWAGVA